MKTLLILTVVGTFLVWCPPDVQAQDVAELFRKINPSVVVIRAKGREVTAARGIAQFSETGSGVLVSADGKIMTAAHVVHNMDEITVEFLGGETMKAHIVASEPAADLSLLQLQSVRGAREHFSLGGPSLPLLALSRPWAVTQAFVAFLVTATATGAGRADSCAP